MLGLKRSATQSGLRSDEHASELATTTMEKEAFSRENLTWSFTHLLTRRELLLSGIPL